MHAAGTPWPGAVSQIRCALNSRRPKTSDGSQQLWQKVCGCRPVGSAATPPQRRPASANLYRDGRSQPTSRHFKSESACPPIPGTQVSGWSTYALCQRQTLSSGECGPPKSVAALYGTAMSPRQIGLARKVLSENHRRRFVRARSITSLARPSITAFSRNRLK
jgi:hypothetical protein